MFINKFSFKILILFSFFSFDIFANEPQEQVQPARRTQVFEQADGRPLFELIYDGYDEKNNQLKYKKYSYNKHGKKSENPDFVYAGKIKRNYVSHTQLTNYYSESGYKNDKYYIKKNPLSAVEFELALRNLADEEDFEKFLNFNKNRQREIREKEIEYQKKKSSKRSPSSHRD
ncbi:MAG: hypothetical protein AABY64_07670 [Bdellovibrionota bacterium]